MGQYCDTLVYHNIAIMFQYMYRYCKLSLNHNTSINKMLYNDSILLKIMRNILMHYGNILYSTKPWQEENLVNHHNSPSIFCQYSHCSMCSCSLCHERMTREARQLNIDALAYE